MDGPQYLKEHHNHNLLQDMDILELTLFCFRLQFLLQSPCSNGANHGPETCVCRSEMG